MAIQPIDLQALFSQIDKVGKNQAVVREGQQIHDSLQQMETQRKLEENVRSVNETPDMGEETIKVKDEKGGGPQGKNGGKENQEDDDEPPARNFNSTFFKDPALGKNIDITG